MNTASKPRLRRACATLAAIAATGATLAAPGAAFGAAAQADAGVAQDRAAHTITASGGGMALVVDYSDGVRISSLLLSGVETLDDGGWSALETEGAGELDSRVPASEPTVQVSGQTATVTFEMVNDAVSVVETWTIEAGEDGVDVETSRTYDWASDEGGVVVHNGQLELDWTRDFDNIRRPGDGGNVPIGNDYAGAEGFFLNKTNDRYGVEQADQVLLSQKLDAGVRVTANSDRRLATEYAYTGDSTSLETQVSAADGWEYTAGTPESGLVYGGHSSTQTDNDIFAPVAVGDGQTDTVAFRFSATDRASFYDIGGTIPGIEDPDAFASLLHDFGRSGVVDTGYGMSTVGTRYPGMGPYDLVFTDRTVLGYDDPAMLEAEKNVIEYFRDYGQGDDGHMKGRTFHRTYEWRDSTLAEADPAYAQSVANLFGVDGDREWLDSVHGSVTEALDFMFRERFHADRGMFDNGVTDCTVDKGSREWNDAFFVCNESGYVNELMYDALVKWAAIEKDVYRDDERAALYADTAARMRETFNKDASDGGFWDPATNMFAYWRETDGAVKGAVQQMQVNLRAIQYGMVDRDRAIAILDGVDEQMAKNDLDMLPMNFWPIGREDEWSGDHFQTGLEDGAIYPFMIEEYMRAAAVVGERERGVEYMNNAIERYAADGYVGYSYVTWEGAPKKQEEWFPANAMVAGGMYLDVLGIQPTRDGLTIAPNLPASVNGAEVTREIHPDQFATITYDDAVSQTVDYAAEGESVTMLWSGQEPGQRYFVVDNKKRTKVIADDMGRIAYTFPADGTHEVFVAKGNADGYVLPEPEGDNVADGAVATASSSLEDEWFGLDRVTDGNRFSADWTNGWSSDSDLGENHEEWLQLDLGQAHELSTIELLPRNYDAKEQGLGYPKDFTIEVSVDGETWTRVAEETDFPTPTGMTQPGWEFEPTLARYVRVTGTELTQADDGYRMQFAEVTALVARADAPGHPGNGHH